MAENERHDPKQAKADAHQKSREKGAAPHYLRCEWYQGIYRCVLAEDHPGPHIFKQATI